MLRMRVALPPLRMYPLKDLYISIVSVTDVTETDHEGSASVEIRPGAYSMYVVFVLHLCYSVLLNFI
jgi:hypothetical protein